MFSSVQSVGMGRNYHSFIPKFRAWISRVGVAATSFSMPALCKIWFVFIVQTCSKYGYDSLIHSFRWILFADQLLDLALVVDEWFFSQCFFCHMRKNTISHSSMQSLPCAMVKHKIEFRKGHVSMALTRVLFYSQHEPHNWTCFAAREYSTAPPSFYPWKSHRFVFDTQHIAVGTGPKNWFSLRTVSA